MDALNVQLYAFATILIAGASTGLLFDFYRLLRSWLQPGTISTVIMDLFFWLVLAPMLIIYILMANWGELRFYVLIGIILGLAFYYLIFSKIVIRIILGVTSIIGKIISFIMGIVFIIIGWPIRLLQDLSFGLITRKRRSLGKGLRLTRPKLRWKSPFGLLSFRRR